MSTRYILTLVSCAALAELGGVLYLVVSGEWVADYRRDPALVMFPILGAAYGALLRWLFLNVAKQNRNRLVLSGALSAILIAVSLLDEVVRKPDLLWPYVGCIVLALVIGVSIGFVVSSQMKPEKSMAHVFD